MIRELLPTDAQSFWELRLSALKQTPDAFAASFEEWQLRSVRDVEAQLRDSYQSPNEFILGVFQGSLVGMAGFFREKELKLRHKGRVWGVYVLPEWRGQGLAGKMLDQLISQAKDMPGLEQIQLRVVTANVEAISLYEAHGFQTFGIERCALRIDTHYCDEAHMVLFLNAEVSSVEAHAA